MLQTNADDPAFAKNGWEKSDALYVRYYTGWECPMDEKIAILIES